MTNGRIAVAIAETLESAVKKRIAALPERSAVSLELFIVSFPFSWNELARLRKMTFPDFGHAART
jgi:hypothetical protein